MYSIGAVQPDWKRYAKRSVQWGANAMYHTIAFTADLAVSTAWRLFTRFATRWLSFLGWLQPVITASQLRLAERPGELITGEEIKAAADCPAIARGRGR